MINAEVLNYAIQQHVDEYHTQHPKQETTCDTVLKTYDAGVLNDHGGGNVEWWQDYIRYELARAHEFYCSQIIE